MGAQSNGAALTETRGDPAAAGTHLFVGVDIGRFYHLVAAIPQERMENGSWERAVARRFATSADGFEELVAWLHSFDVSVDDIRVGLEPTGGLYSRTVVAWLVRHGFQVDWLQNWAVHDRRHLLIGKQAKSDALDARLIARLLYERECLGLVGGFLHRTPMAAEGLRMLVRNRFKLLSLHTRHRLQLAALEDVLFPEFKEVFRGSQTKLAARRVLEHFPTPADLAVAPREDIREVIYRQAKAMRLVEAADRLQTLAARSAGLVEGIEEIVRTQRHVLRELNVLDEELRIADAAIAEALESWPPRQRAILDSLPGMSVQRQAVLLSAIGDLGTFRTDRELRKLLGWYPETLESGSSVSKHRLGLSGNRLARRELWLWSMSIVAPRFPANPFKDYYARLRARNLAGHVAIGHVAGKLISVLFYCMRNGEPYDPVRHARDLGFG
ncbi:MAG TPA: IS110 family transposase [Chloroflexi bacterium]|jgi:transposase|nr:IS110 family transposase [Chloroflexota bacterium]